jgi:tRNA (guanine-N7-)-methyltransferase
LCGHGRRTLVKYHHGTDQWFTDHGRDVMRIKSSKGMENRILESSRYVKDPYCYKEKWNEYFGNSNEIHMELGMGKGDFIIGMASACPEINYIGVELYMVVIARAAGKLESTSIGNIALVVDDIMNIGEIVPSNSIGRIYLNFLDPWPKNRHEKRRCTSDKYLAIYHDVLKASGQIHFKTDNSDFYSYTLNNLRNSGFKVLLETTDLYGSENSAGNIQTEYEKKFAAKGEKIKKIVAANHP